MSNTLREVNARLLARIESAKEKMKTLGIEISVLESVCFDLGDSIDVLTDAVSFADTLQEEIDALPKS